MSAPPPAPAASYGDRRPSGTVTARDCAPGAVIGIALGHVFRLVGDGGAWSTPARTTPSPS